MASKRKQSQELGLGKILTFAAIIIICVAVWHMVTASAQKAGSGSSLADSLQLTYVITNPQLQQREIDYPGMTISFNRSMHEPNWVAWELTADETTGTIAREKSFYCDESIEGCAETYDYSYSGYDRGHMCPAGDMKWSKESMHASFSLANICPQAKSLNTGAWKRLEEKCRTWAKADGSLIIICGPILTDPIREFIGDTRVAVPKRFFKVILSPNANPVRGIGFIMPNDKVPGGMQAAAVSIDEVERQTGHDFFSALPDYIENEVEQQCDFHYWSTIK